MKKSSKKHRRRQLFHILFLLCVAGALIWLVLTPAPRHIRPEAAHVRVEQPEVVLPPRGDEKAQPEETAVPQPVPVLPKHPLGKMEIAIIIDDVGLDMKGSKRAILLPAPVTLSFMPYATRLKEQTREARDQGHELMLHMPMEPMGHDDPGPGALLVNLPMEELRQRFETALASFVGFDGVNNHMGSKFTADTGGMEMVVGELQQRHLFFVDSRTSAQSVGESIARQHGVPTIARDVFLDDDMAIEAVKKQLAQTEHVAQRKGYVVAIGHPHAATLEALEQWIPEAEARGFKLVPVHDLINPPN